MSENDTEKRSNIWKDVAGQISDHVDLASLEMRYEAAWAGKKMLAAAIVFILVLTGFIVLQVSVIGGLMKLGLTLSLSTFLVSVVYFGLAYVVFWVLGKRDQRAGPPFVGTQKELHETLRWIQKILS